MGDRSGEDEAFIRQYERRVGKIVAECRGQLGLKDEVEDLMAYGYAGLLEARKRYEPERGVPFQSYAYFRIRGAVLNGARAMGRLSRRAQAALAAAEAMDERAEQVAWTLGGGTRFDTEGALGVMDDVLGRGAAAYAATLALAEDPGESPEEALEHRERRAVMLQAVSQLPDRERRIIEGHYLAGRPLDEVIAELGYSRSGGRSANGRALGLLRQALQAC